MSTVSLAAALYSSTLSLLVFKLSMPSRGTWALANALPDEAEAALVCTQTGWVCLSIQLFWSACAARLCAYG